MGADYWSIAVAGEAHEAVEEAVASWLARKVWLHDSDIWGYELVEEGSIVSAFHSNPRYFGPEEMRRGPDDPEALAALTGVDAETIRALRSRRAVFKERVWLSTARAAGGTAAPGPRYEVRSVIETFEVVPAGA